MLVPLVTILFACTRRDVPKPTPSTEPVIAAPAPEAPLPKLTATSGELAVGNMDAQIESLTQRSVDYNVRASLVDMLLSRGQYLGRIADYDRAATLAQSIVDEAPTVAVGFLARASTRATFHDFDLALKDLDEAERLGAPKEKLAPSRSSIAAARGKLDEALQLRPIDEGSRSITELATAGFLLGDLGRTDDAERLLTFARDRYADVSPFPLAWIDAKQGALYERLGKLEKAKLHYARAIALLPRYATAAAHLAGLSTPAEAVALLEPLTSSSDDPEVRVQLADALRRVGRVDEGKRQLEAAIGRYDELMKTHPLAFADHAAVMWLGPGRDPEKALSLAKINLANRHSAEAYGLLLDAALASKMQNSICTEAREAIALPHAPATLSLRANMILRACS